MSGDASPYALPPCEKHGDDTCASCYAFRAREEDVDALVALHHGAEASAIRGPGTAHRSRRYYHLFPPTAFQVRLSALLVAREGQKLPSTTARAECIAQAEAFAKVMEEQLVARGRKTAP